MKILEAAAAVAATAGYGQFRVKNTTPNQPWFADDAGTDFAIVLSDETGGNNEIARYDEDGRRIQGYTSNAPTISDTGEITIDTDKKIFLRDSAIYLHSPADGDVLLNADTDVQFGIGGSEVARFDSNGNLLINVTTGTAASVLLELSKDDSACNFRVEGHGTASQNPRSQYIKSSGTRGSPTAVAATDVCMNLQCGQYTGAAYITKASIRVYAVDANNAEWKIATGGGSLTNRMTIDEAGNVDLTTAGAYLTFNNDVANYFIRGLTSEGMIYNCATALQHRFKVAGTAEAYIGANYMGLGAVGSQEGGFDWSTAGQVDYEDGSGNVLMSIAGASKWSVYGATPVVQAAGMTAALTDVSFTAPGTPDYASVFSSGGWGWTSQDKARTFASVVRNLQDRVNELEAALDATTGVGILA